VSRRRYPVVLAVGFLVVLVAAFGAVSGPCADFTATAPVAAFDIDVAGDRVIVTLTDGRIPAADTRRLELAVRAAEGDGPVATDTLVGPDGPPVEEGDRFTVESVTVAGRSLRDGDRVRVVWRGYDLDEQPFFCPPEERTLQSATMAARTVGESG
jgi:hypothetical protein